MSCTFLSGQLPVSFAHEVHNKWSALDIQLSNARAHLERLRQAVPGVNQQADFGELANLWTR